MITEDSISDQNEKKPLIEEVAEENTSAETPEIKEPKEIPNEEIEEENSENIPVVEEPAEVLQDTPEHQADVETQASTVIPEDEVLSEIDPAKADHDEPQESENHDSDLEETATLSLPEILQEMEAIINKEDAGAQFRTFNHLKEQANHFIHDDIEDHKNEFVNAGNEAENFVYHHPLQSKLSGLIHVFREKNDDYTKKQEANHSKNLEDRQNIIENLKTLYTNTEAGTNLFKAIREIKEAWKNAGQVAKSEFKILNNNYFHHLNQFYQMLDLNKEFLEQEYSHNLEKRQHIIARAKELENEPVVQKALNELQYLHKLWKEEAEPVAEEFREKTWDEFKEISNKIHERKSELSAAIETEQNANLEKKNEIIAEIKKLSEPNDNPNHNYWQNSIKRVEDLRSEFLKTGSVPRKLSNNNWNDFKSILRSFNTIKNNYYKSLKGSQQGNLDEKLKLIQTAKDNMLSEDWETAVALFKKLQDDWKKIGHVPKSMTNKIWDEFRETCNTFINNYREKSSASTDN